jgi:hypothetical protein
VTGKRVRKRCLQVTGGAGHTAPGKYTRRFIQYG